MTLMVEAKQGQAADTYLKRQELLYMEGISPCVAVSLRDSACQTLCSLTHLRNHSLSGLARYCKLNMGGADRTVPTLLPSLTEAQDTPNCN